MSICLIGCALPTKIIVKEPVGPSPASVSDAASREGRLQVFSARERAPSDVNKEMFLGNEFDHNDYLYEKAHTDYFVYDAQGKLVEKVKNASAVKDLSPIPVHLPAGTYRIEADAELSNGSAFTVDLPVVIKPGLTTAVHLGKDWKPKAKPVASLPLVRIYEGRIIGWRADASNQEPKP